MMGPESGGAYDLLVGFFWLAVVIVLSPIALGLVVAIVWWLYSKLMEWYEKNKSNPTR